MRISKVRRQKTKMFKGFLSLHRLNLAMLSENYDFVKFNNFVYCKECFSKVTPTFIFNSLLAKSKYLQIFLIYKKNL